MVLQEQPFDMNDRNVLLRALAPAFASDAAPSELLSHQMNEVLACDDASYDDGRQHLASQTSDP